MTDTHLLESNYYHFRNDNASVLQMETDEKFFSFIVKTEFESKHRFDQCGIVMYLDRYTPVPASHHAPAYSRSPHAVLPCRASSAAVSCRSPSAGRIAHIFRRFQPGCEEAAVEEILAEYGIYHTPRIPSRIYVPPDVPAHGPQKHGRPASAPSQGTLSAAVCVR